MFGKEGVKISKTGKSNWDERGGKTWESLVRTTMS
jgi:hypothetical protein